MDDNTRYAPNEIKNLKPNGSWVRILAMTSIKKLRNLSTLTFPEKVSLVRLFHSDICFVQNVTVELYVLLIFLAEQSPI